MPAPDFSSRRSLDAEDGRPSPGTGEPGRPRRRRPRRPGGPNGRRESLERFHPVSGGSVRPATFLTVAGAVLVLGVAFVGVGVGISAGARSTTVAGGFGFVAFVLAFGVWGSLPGLLATALNGFSPTPPPDWAPLFRTLNPVTSFRVLLSTLIEGGTVGSGVVRSLPLAVLVFVGWATLAPLAGYLRLRTDDL